MVRKLIGTIATMGVLVAVLSLSVLALFTDSDAVGTNSFATGTLSLTTSPTSTVWTAVTDSAPGDKATGRANSHERWVAGVAVRGDRRQY